MKFKSFAFSVIAAAAFARCAAQEASEARPAGSASKTDTNVLQAGAGVLQAHAPVRQLEVYLDGFHGMKNDIKLQMEAHHYCGAKGEDFLQCVIFDGNTKDANLIGIEYIISGEIFDKLPAAEKKYWHPHNYEILSGQLVAPGLPDAAEKALLKKKMNSYGKTWHVWDTHHGPAQAAGNLPLGDPMLAWSFNKDGQALPELVRARDENLKIDSAQKRADRRDLTPFAKPQMGTEVWQN